MNEFGGNPLAADDPLRNNSPATEFGALPRGLGLTGGTPAVPLGMQNPANGLAPANADLAQQLGNFTPGPLLTPAATTTEPQMFYSPSTGDMVINGFTFNQRNATQALASEQWANQPRQQFTLPDTATDWRELSRPEYQSYIDSIRNPGYDRRIGEAWEHAWRGVGDVGLGASLAANPDWEWAQTARQNIAREYEENAPFMLRMRDVQNPGDALTYASQMLVQSAPWIVETIASMAAGAAIGGAVSGGLGAPAGAVEGFIAKEAIRRSTMTMLQQNLRRGAEAYAASAARRVGTQLTRQIVTRDAVRAGTASADDVNRFFNFGERAYHLTRGARDAAGDINSVLRSTGAVAGGGASNYAAAVGDIRNSIADAGGDPTSAEAAAQIWGMAIPYAAIESVGDLIITQPITQIFPGIGHGPSHIGNAARGAATGYTTESLQEGAQYGITQNAAAQVTNTPLSIEPIDLLEVMVGGGLAGAGAGALIGGIGATRQPVAGLLPPPRMPMGGPTTTPTGTPSPAAPIMPTDLNAMSGQLAGIRAQEGGGAYMGAVQDELRSAPTGQPRIYEEREALSNKLLNPDLTPDQRSSILQSLEALQGGQDVDVEAAQRAAGQQSRGVMPTDPIVTSEPDLSVPITQEELAGLQGPGRAETRADLDIPPGLSQIGTGGRNPVAIFQDLAMGQEVPREEMLQLRNAIAQLQKDNPTNPGYAQVLSQLDSMMVEAPPLTDENSPEFKAKYPELSERLANKQPGFTVSPMDAARTIKSVPLVASDKVGAQVRKLPPAIANPNIKFDDGLRGRTEETAPKVEAKQSGENLLARTYQLDARDNLSELSDEELNRVHQITKVKKGKSAHKDLHERLTEELDKRQVAKGGKNKSRRRMKERLKKEGKGRLVQGDMLVTPVEAKKEEPDAVQERSPAKPPVQDRPRTGEKDGSGDRTRYEAPRESPKPASDEKVQGPEIDPGLEDVYGHSVDRKRVDKAYAAGVAHYPTLYSFLQGARGLLRRDKHTNPDTPIKTAQEWAKPDGKPLTVGEARAIVIRLQALDVRKDTPNGATKTEEKKAEPTPDKAERKAASFGADMSQFFKDNKDKPAALKEYVEGHTKEITAWLTSEDAKVRAGLRERVRALVPKPPAPTVQMVGPYVARLRVPTQAMVMKPGPHDNKIVSITKSGIEGNLKFVAQQVKLFNEGRASRGALEQAVKALASSINLWPKASADTETLAELQSLLAQLQKAAAEAKGGVQQIATDSNAAPKANRLTVRSIKMAIDKIQRVINPKMKYNNVHVVQDFQELLDTAEQLELTRPDGTKTNIYDAAADADPQGDPTTWLKTYVGHARAANFTYYNALIVIADHMKTGNVDDLMSVLEHEYIVHRGLSVLFENDVERNMFLHRVGLIPGMEEKRQDFLFKYPIYARTVGYLGHIEEILAFHSMEGPKALRELLTAKEGIDPETRRTLWEDFVGLVKRWLERLGQFFPSLTPDADKALDAVVSALREHAIVGGTIDLNARLDGLGVPSFAELYKKHTGLDLNESNPVQQVVRSTTMEDTATLLFGTNENPGRPYTPTPWTEQMGNTIKSNLPLMGKIKELSGKGVGTTTREAIKKVGRNIETTDKMALRSTLVEKTMEIMHNTIAVARRLMTKRQETRSYASKSEELAGLRKVWGDKAPGSTQKQRDAYNQMAVVATNGKLPLISESLVRAAPRILVRHANGTYDINRPVFEAMLARGTYTKADFEAGIEQFTVHGDGKTTSTGVAKLSQDVIDAGYDVYLAETRHMAESHLETLEHALHMLTHMNDTTVKRLLADNKLSERDQAFMDDMLQHMYKLYADIAFHDHTTISRRQRYKQQEIARQVLAELMRAMHEKEKVSDWLDSTKKRDASAKSPRINDAFKWRELATPHADVAPFVNQIRWFLQNDPASGMNRLERMNEVGIAKKPQFAMLGAFQALLNTEKLAYEHENDVIQSTLGNYVEFTRKGQWRVFVDVKDNNGKPADIGPELSAMLPVVYVRTEREAKDLINELYAELGGTHTVNDAGGDLIEITFDVGYGKAPGTRTLAEAPKIKQFLEVADLAGLSLNASQMKTVANLIENASSRKRFGLQRAGTPGMDANILENNSETMTRRAWWAAKMSQAWPLDSVFADYKNIYGDWSRLDQLQKAFDLADRGAPMGQPTPMGFFRNEQEVYLAETALLRYAHQMRYMAKHTLSRPQVVIRTTKGEQKFTIEPEGAAHHDHAVALRESLERNELELNLNDLLSKTGPLRMMAVVMQLGSIASGIMNVFTLVTHLPWVLTARHGKTGYGEGFSMGEVAAEIMGAARQTMFALKMKDSAHVKELLDNAKAGDNSSGLTVEELEFLYNETLQGLLMPQQTYSMTGGTESNISSLILRNLSEGLLEPFAAMEAANRRISALATYRLAKKRYIAAGADPAKLADVTSPEYKKLVQDVERVVYQSQGDYANVNRPKSFRGDLAQYVLMYKMFPLMTVQMLQNLPRPQQLAVLGVLFLLGGLKAEPFADDIMDIYDTVLQKLGFTHDSVELQLIQTFEKILPGSSRWIMTGAIDTLAFGGTMSSRVSMGDILPMTGAFREGADMGREIANAFGPAYAANVSMLEFLWTTTDGIMQLLGMKNRTMTFDDWLRKIPQSQIRSIAEGGMMAANGEITDPRGRLVSDEVDPLSIASRIAGFYPLEATKANTAVRLDRMHIGYMRAVRARFILAYANAYRAGDQEMMENLRDQVREWNESAEDTGQEDMMIRNFRSAALRAGRAAAQTTIERTSSSAPNYSLIDELAQIVGADEEADD